MLGTLNSLATVVLDPVTTVLKDSARPAYWVPDEDCFDCFKENWNFILPKF